MLDKKIINKYPASGWSLAHPVGNGRLGASIYGAIYDERILINHEDLYDGTVKKDIPDVSYALKEVRKLMDEKKYQEAENYYLNLFKEKNYYANKGSYFPAFDLHLIYDTKQAFTNYERKLDLAHGVSSVSFKEDGIKSTRECFASFTDKYVFLHIMKEKPFSCSLSLEPHDQLDSIDFWGNNMKSVEKYESFQKDRYIYSSIESVHGLKFSGMIKVIDTDGSIESFSKDYKNLAEMSGNTILENSITINDATYLVVAVNVESKVISFEEHKAILDEIKDSIDVLKKRHEKAFSDVYNRTILDISDNDENLSNEQLFLNSYDGNIDLRLIQKMADFGRYLLVSSSFHCKWPANLQGIWNGDYTPVWSSAFFNNENIQMMYWQAFMGNLNETACPLFGLYEKFMDDYRENASKIYGCRGILIPLFMDNKSGKKDNLQPHVIYWTGSSAWISAIFFDYYLYTLDEKFLLERAYPFMKEAALFYEDFMVKENGKLKSYPSDSPENRPLGNFEGAGSISCSINSTMDFSLLKELLTNLLYANEKYNLHDEKESTWKELLQAIPPYEINSDGAIKEWLYDDFKDNYHHRHLSHIYCLFPGFEITKENNPKLFDAINMAVSKRLTIGLKEQTGWSFAHMANIYDRLGQGDKSLECLNNLVRFCTDENLYTHHNDWRNMGVTLKFLYCKKAPFQVDAIMGFVSGVYEMLLSTRLCEAKILPALPTKFKKGSIKGLKGRGNFTFDISWNETSCDVSVTSHSGLPLKLYINEKYSDKEFIELTFKPEEIKHLHFAKGEDYEK